MTRGVRRILVTVLSTVAVLGVLEAGARLVRTSPSPAAGPEWLEYSAHIGWQSRAGSRGHALAAERRGQRLVMLLGDSRTFGNGVRPEETYGRVLERRLPSLDVINRAVPGYSSLQGLIALQTDAPRFRPDVVVFAFDFNDRRYVLPPSDVDSREHFRRLARLAAWDRLTSAVALVDLARRPGRLGPDRDVQRPLDLGAVRPRVSAIDFREHLEAAARYSADHGIALVFLILNDNVAQARDFDEGARALRAGRRPEAERALQAAVAHGNAFSEGARLQLARLYEQTGRGEAAARVRVSPRTFHSVTGGYPIVPGEEYRTVIREVAAKTGRRLVDAGSEIDRVPARYVDFCHFDADGHRIVADLLAAALR